MKTEIKIRICMLSIILLSLINVLIALTIADRYEANYRNSRFLALQFEQNSSYLDFDSPEINEIKLQSKLVWETKLYSNLIKGFIIIGIYSAFIVLLLLRSKNLQLKNKNTRA